jgi:hypothetical protein
MDIPDIAVTYFEEGLCRYSIATDVRRIGVQFSEAAKDVSVLHRIEIFSGAHQTSDLKCTKVSFLLE